ncbi:MAG: ABC transporter permease subunit, partial [Deltaproteobacteria bacterium]
MTRPPSLGKLFGRITLGIVSVVLVGALSYGLLLPLVLGQADASLGALGVGMLVGLAVSLALIVQCLLLLPRLRRLVDAAAKREPPDPLDLDEVYATPRTASFRVGIAGACALVIGYLPFGGAIVQERTLAANVGAVCAALTAGVLYASLRVAMRPLLEALRDDGRWEWDLDEAPVPTGDSLALRVALAVAIPASAAALLATLLVGAHLTNVAADQRASARESFNQALSVPPRPGESESGQEVAASALRGADMPVVSENGVYEVPPIVETPPTPPFWSIPIALLVGLVAGPLFGRRIGERASLDLESAARRMITVGVSDIRTVTMGMARPQSVPEIREMALALDTLAATLLRMAAAYVASIVFAIAYGYVAATQPRAERVLMPLLDILQSVPVLGFFPAATALFVGVFHGRLGLELASIFLIFTSQAWNIAFGVYEAITTLPHDANEAFDAFGL